jgi:two-component system nitrogen regulation response regulator NtrX
MRILIVDDERTIRETLREILEDEGYEVFTEEVGSRVVEKIEELHPAVVILDLFLPGTSGMEILEELRSKGLTGKVAVIVLSGHGTVESAVKAMKLGAFDFLEKPVKYEELLSTVEAAVNAVSGKTTLSSVEAYAQLPLRKARENFERDYILKVLEKFDGDLKKAAQFMEIDISNLYRKLNKYGLSKD